MKQKTIINQLETDKKLISILKKLPNIIGILKMKTQKNILYIAIQL